MDRIIDQAPYAMWISDTNGTVQRVNPALKNFLNLSDEQLVGKYNVFEDPAAKRQGLLPQFKTVYDDLKSIRFTCGWDGKDYSKLDLEKANSVVLEGTMFPILNPEGELTNVVLNWIDVTEQKKAQDALNAEHQFSKSVIETAQAIIVVLDTEGRIVRYNRYLDELSGYKLEETKGKDWFSTFLPDRKSVV